jgi:Protein of unknown function (DUF2384)
MANAERYCAAGAGIPGWRPAEPRGCFSIAVSARLPGRRAAPTIAPPGWLRKSKMRFEGRSPLEMMRTEAAARMVEEMLLQLDYGFVA